jgi:hypothetical protein
MKSAVFCTKKRVKSPEIEGVFCSLTHYTTTDLGSETFYCSTSFAGNNPVKYTDPTGRSQVPVIPKTVETGEKITDGVNAMGKGGWITVGIIAGVVLTLGLLYFLSDDVKEIVNKGIDAIKNWARKHCIDISEDGLGKDVGEKKKIILNPLPKIKIGDPFKDSEKENNYPKDKPGLPLPNYPTDKPIAPGIPKETPEDKQDRKHPNSNSSE